MTLFWRFTLKIQHLIFALLREKHRVILKKRTACQKTLFPFLCHRYTNSCPRAQTPRGLTGRGRGGRDRERGDGAEKSLILPLPLPPPDEHPPDYYLWAPLSSTQQLAAPRLPPIDYSGATADISLSPAGRSVLYGCGVSRIRRTNTFMPTVKRKWQNHWQEEGEPVRVGTAKRRRSAAILSQCQCRRLP